MNPKCFCDQMDPGQLCDYCEREKYQEQQAQAIDDILHGDF